jgi:hypothetical protein
MAQALIGTNQIADNAITSPKIKDGEVKTPDLASNPVTGDKIGNREVGSSDISPGAITPHVTERRGERVTVEVERVGSTNAKCNADEVVTGGGFFSSNGLDVLTSKADLSNNEWFVIAFNKGTTPHELDAFVICLNLVP